MRCYFITRALRTHNLSRVTPGTTHTCAWEGILWKFFMLFLQKGGKMFGLKVWNRKWLEERRIETIRHVETERLCDLFWIGCLEMEGIEGARQIWVCQQAGRRGEGTKMLKGMSVCLCFVDSRGLYLACKNWHSCGSLRKLRKEWIFAQNTFVGNWTTFWFLSYCKSKHVE